MQVVEIAGAPQVEGEVGPGLLRERSDRRVVAPITELFSSVTSPVTEAFKRSSTPPLPTVTMGVVTLPPE